MADKESVGMLAELMDYAGSGKKVDLEVKPGRKVVRFEQEGRQVDSVILFMEYSGSIDGEPFVFKKDYSFVDDDAHYALDCLLKVRRWLCEIVFGCKPFALNLHFYLDVTLELRRSKHTRVAGE